MYKDEYRDPNSLMELRIAETLSDPQSTFSKFQNLNGRDFKSELVKFERERLQLNDRVKDAQKSVTELRNQNAQLREQRDLAQKRLEKLRNSRTMRLGKTVARPAKIARRFVREPRGATAESARRFNNEWGKLRSSLRAALKNKESDSKGNTSVNRLKTNKSKIQTTEAAQALREFRLDPSVNSFVITLNFLWFERGTITEAAQFVSENSEFIAQAPEQTASLALRVLSEERLINGKIPIPPRSQEPAYVSEPKRVMYCVHQTPVYNSNGYSTRTRGVANGLSTAGGDVTVVARAGYPWDSKADVPKPSSERNEETLDGVQYVHLPGGNLNRDPLDQYFMVCSDAFVREARMQRPSLIQSASNYRTAIPALIAARRLGIPFVYEVRGLWELTEASKKPGFELTQRFELMRHLETMVAKQSDLVLAITSEVKQELIARGVEESKIQIAPNAVDPDKFLPVPKDIGFAEKNGVRTDIPVIGFAGSLVDYEGVGDLISASEILKSKGIEHQIVIAGSGAAEPNLRKQVEDLGLDENVKFLGRLSQEDMPRLQSAFDIVACPRKSTIVTELVSPLKPLESFASGRPTVLSAVAPHFALSGDGQRRALLSSPDDPLSLAQVLQRLIDDAELRSNLARAARLWVVEQRTWLKLGDKLLSSHKKATSSYDSLVRTNRPVSDLKVGVIADEFTLTSLEGSLTLIYLNRKSWKSQIGEGSGIDLLFVESAWEGNGGQWRRGIGHYSDTESSDLREMLGEASRLNIPTVFWNKEDPVHFSRFAPNAALFDHVFTTDASMIPKYLSNATHNNKTVSSLPFFAQPKVHNPLVTAQAFRHSVAYAGSYYGDRYKERSEALERLLSAASRFPLDIYDRQANNPNSPYSFPVKYREYVRGGLSYKETIASYGSHIAHLNVNSVMDSPTMFSRRVVEIPACGGIVLSDYGRGVAESLGSNIAQSSRPGDYRAWLYDWAENSGGRLGEIWRQMRTIFRSHTAESALAIVARTAGIPVQGIKPLDYAVEIYEDESNVSSNRLDIVHSLISQSILPKAIFIENATKVERENCADAGIQVIGGSTDIASFEYVVSVDRPVQRTYVEDVLLPSRFGDWDAFYVKSDSEFDDSHRIVEYHEDASSDGSTLVARRSIPTGAGSVVTTLSPSEAGKDLGKSLTESPVPLQGKTVLIAGHDLKFAGDLIEGLHNQDCEILFDNWTGHNAHNETVSLELLSRADVVFCEWGLGNAVWYAQHVGPEQRLVVRVHSQELFLPYLKRIEMDNVERFIFVGELIRSAAVISHEVPREKTVVIHNSVDVDRLDMKKLDGAEKTIGFVGMVPRSKRLDRAIDIVEKLLSVDSNYVLRIKGKTPSDYPWMENRPDELEYFDRLIKRIEKLNLKFPGCIVFDGFGDDMHEWYRAIGIALSTSDFESFHLTIADGAASGAIPVCFNWPGADRIYPLHWLVDSIESAVARIQEIASFQELSYPRSQAAEFSCNRFDTKLIVDRLIRELSD